MELVCTPHGAQYEGAGARKCEQPYGAGTFVLPPRPKITYSPELLLEEDNFACPFLDTFEFGPYNQLYAFLGRRATAQVARTSYRMHQWAVRHRSHDVELTFQRSYEIPRQFPKVYPNVVTLTTWQQSVGVFAKNCCVDPCLTTMFSWANIQHLHFYVSRHMTLEEAMSFGVMRNLRWLTIESTSWRPLLRSRCRATRGYFDCDEVIGEHFRTDVEFMIELGRHAHSLHHLDVKGLQRLANHWDAYTTFLGEHWPQLEFISPLPASSKKQVLLLRTLANLSPQSVTNIAPQAIFQCPPHLRQALTSLHIRIPVSERSAIDRKPYLDFGSILELCPNVTHLDVSEKLDVRQQRCRCTKPTLIFTPSPACTRHPLQRLAVNRSGRLVLQDIGSLIMRCPQLKDIYYAISAKYKFERAGMPNRQERDILRVLKQRKMLRVVQTPNAVMPQSVTNQTWGGHEAAAFFKGTSCWS